MADKQEKEKPSLCVCGRMPVTVRYQGKKMLSCPAQDKCTMRSRWCKNEQEAVKDWNATVQASRHKGGGAKRATAKAI